MTFNKKEWHKQYYLKNKEHKIKEYRLKKREYIKEWQKEYKLKNKEQIKEYNLKNKERIKEYQKKYNKEYNLKNKERRNKQLKERRKTDINFRLTHNLRSRLRSVLKGINKSASTMKLIGCTIDELRSHLESKFKPWMTWENYGLWDVDHRVACAKFDLTCPEQQRICFNYKNLQPMHHIENIRKGAR